MPAPAVARRTALALCTAALLAGCQVYTPFRDTNARDNEDMQAVVHVYQQLGAKPVSTLDVTQARTQPTFQDAIRRVVSNQRGQPWIADSYTQERDLTVAGAAGPLPARLFDATPGKAGEPIILFFHGGGFVTGGIDSSDLICRELADQAHAKVLSVAYRLAPENRFPAAEDDALAAYRWLLANAASLGADPRRIAVAGDDAGANLAINVSIASRAAGVTPPVHELLISPIASTDFRDPTYIAEDYAIPLSPRDMRWYLDNTIRSRADLGDPRLDLVGRADLHNLPPTTVISAEMDPLQSEGTFLTQKLQAQGNDVARILYGGTSHDFFAAGPVIERAKEAEAYAAQHLDETFDKIGPPPPPPPTRAERGRPGRPVHHAVHRRQR
jgi:acetyl esterase/lipase